MRASPFRRRSTTAPTRKAGWRGSEVRLARHLEHHGQEDHAHQEVQELQPASPKDEARPAQVGPMGGSVCPGQRGPRRRRAASRSRASMPPSPGRVAAPLASPP